jgi:hypothetical protein
VKVTRGKATYFDIEVDGKRLAEHFADRHGAHPSQLSPLGWNSANETYRAKVVAQLLAERPSELKSGRVPVLVCEECGDVRCGAFTVQVVREGEHIKWTDWAFENGSDPAQEMIWPTRPGDLIFERNAYEIEIRKTLWSGSFNQRIYWTMTITEKLRRNLILALAVGIGLIGVLIAWHFQHTLYNAESRAEFWWFVFNICPVIIGFITNNLHEMNIPAYYIATFVQWFLVPLLSLEFGENEKVRSRLIK